jgi:hypothetical protein
MEKVDFTFKNGHTRIMGKRQAEILGKLGHGQYLTRDMVANRGAVLPPTPAPVAPPPAPVVLAVADELEALDKDQLHALAKERGVRVHHMAGADKVRAALREAA